MPRPKFAVQHFVACLNAPWEGTAGPHTLRTLEGVGYRYTVPPDTEFPTEFVPGFWLYARFVLTNATGGQRVFYLDLIWRDAGGVAVRDESVWRTPRRLETVAFSTARPVTSKAWSVPVVFPGVGRYVFRLSCRQRGWGGVEFRTVAEEYILIEREP